MKLRFRVWGFSSCLGGGSRGGRQRPSPRRPCGRGRTPLAAGQPGPYPGWPVSPAALPVRTRLRFWGCRSCTCTQTALNLCALIWSQTFALHQLSCCRNPGARAVEPVQNHRARPGWSIIPFQQPKGKSVIATILASMHHYQFKKAPSLILSGA